jgi:ABC-type transporter Mla subunit MlaD
MDYRPSEIKAGIMILAAVVLAVVLLGLLGNWENVFGEKAVVRMDFDSVSGLQLDGEVLYAGQSIGRVISKEFVDVSLTPEALRRLRPDDETYIRQLRRLNLPRDEFAEEMRAYGFATKRIDEELAGYSVAAEAPPLPVVTRVRVLAEIDPEQIFRTGDRAVINQNLTGKTIVDIKPGVGPPLEPVEREGYPERPYYVVETRPTVSLADLTWDAKRIVDQFRRESGPMVQRVHSILENADESVAGVRAIIEENREPIRETIASVRKSADRVAGIAEGGEFDALIADARAVAKEAQDTIKDNRKNIDAFVARLPEIGGNVEDATAEIKGLVEGERFKGLVARAEKSLVAINDLLAAENRAKVKVALTELRKGMQSLSQGLQDLELNPWKLFYKPKPEELTDEYYYMAALALQRGAENLNEVMTILDELSKEGRIDPDSERVRTLMKQTRELLERIDERERTLWQKARER